MTVELVGGPEDGRRMRVANHMKKVKFAIVTPDERDEQTGELKTQPVALYEIEGLPLSGVAVPFLYKGVQ